MLVSDVIMADLNGIETAILMRSLLTQIKVLLFSGQAASADLLAQARTKGYEFELLAKPVHPKDLLRSLRSSGIDSTGEAPVHGDARRPLALGKWIDIAPGDLPVEPVTTQEN
jgi:CheY-like chemotaxis protein